MKLHPLPSLDTVISSSLVAGAMGYGGGFVCSGRTLLGAYQGSLASALATLIQTLTTPIFKAFVSTYSETSITLLQTTISMLAAATILYSVHMPFTLVSITSQIALQLLWQLYLTYSTQRKQNPLQEIPLILIF
ncbi:MAG: hypothetical protein FJZ63_01235 [Chlamydiae bacterium]|nr:hypothetical protein [Chlamydiota bacterium]